jgi:hypothetical protein
MGRRARFVSISLACAALAGCSPLGGSAGTATVTRRSSITSAAKRASTTSAAKLASAQASHEYPSPTPRPQTVAAPAASAIQAVRAFAVGYINWDADTVAAKLRRLVAHSIGQARSAMLLAAAQTASDYELRRGGIANHGTVEAVVALGGSGERYVVVTREWTTATLSTAYQGLRPAWHVAVASVSELAPGQWVVSGWQPES